MAHQSLGLSTAFIAEKVGVVVGRIWDYESTDRAADIPDRAEQVMNELLAQFDGAADELTVKCRRAEVEFIPLYTTPERFDAEVPMLAGWGMLAQGMLAAEVQRRVRKPIEYVP